MPTAIRAKSLAKLELHDQSLDAYDRALALKPDLAEAWLGRGNIFAELKRYDDVFAAYDRASTLKSLTLLKHGAGAATSLPNSSDTTTRSLPTTGHWP